MGKRNFEIDLKKRVLGDRSWVIGDRTTAPPRGIHLLPTTHNLSPEEFVPEVSAQWIEIDVLDAAVKAVLVPSFSHPFGFTRMDPVGGPGAGSPEAVPFHEGFEQMDGVMIDFKPIARDHFGIDGEYPGCQALDRYPGQDEESRSDCIFSYG